MTTTQTNLDQNVDEIQYCSVSDADSDVFSARLYALRTAILSRIPNAKYRKFKDTDGLFYLGSWKFGDKEIGLYELTLDPSNARAIFSRYAPAFGVGDMVYTLDFHTVGKYTYYVNANSPMATPTYTDDEIWVELMEFLNDYYSDL